MEAILVIAALGVAAYAFIRTRGKVARPLAPTPKSTPRLAPTPTPTSTERVERRSATAATPKAPADIEVTDEFRDALSLIDSRQCHVFVTGRAGTGKTTLLRLLQSSSKRNLAVVAPTGLAAINIAGQTIHSFFRLPPRFIDTQEIRRRRDPSVLRALDLLIVDEVSMVRADLMDGIDHALRINRQRDEPFGGVQVALFGDLWQLPPVVRERELVEYFDEAHGGPYFFLGKAWRETECRSIELTRIYRQKDDAEFRDVLQGIRTSTGLESALARVNQQVRSGGANEPPDKFVVLTATNDVANGINARRLFALPGSTRTYSAEVTGKFDQSAYPTDAELSLRPGAKIMFVQNDSHRRWVNGTFGVVRGLKAANITVAVGEEGEGAEVEVIAATWENTEYTYDRQSGRIARQVVGTFKQLPLRLAWAITIHKSQGQTFDHVVIDVGNGAFAHGQTYVALSRCRTLAGIALSRPLTARDVIVDARVAGYTDVFSPG